MERHVERVFRECESCCVYWMRVSRENEIQVRKRVSNTNLSISILNRWNVIRWESPFDEPQHYRYKTEAVQVE